MGHYGNLDIFLIVHMPVCAVPFTVGTMANEPAFKVYIFQIK